MSTDISLRDSDSTVVFIRGRYTFRSFNGSMAVLVLFLAILCFAAPAGHDLIVEGEISGVVAICFLGLSLLSGSLGLRFLFGWLRNEHTHIEINSQGIVNGNRFWPWERVQSIRGAQYANGVSLEFTPKDWSIAWRGGGLPTTPLLTEQRYGELARELSGFLTTHFPHVEVAPTPVQIMGD